MTEREVIEILATRYLTLLNINTDQTLRNMCLTILNHIDDYPEGRLNRWLGFIQKGVIDHGLTTISRENHFSKPLFQKTYTEIKEKD